MLISMTVKSQINPTTQMEYFEKEIAIERRAGLIEGLILGLV